MKKIQSLTKAQEEYLPLFREEYLSAAIGGKRADRERLERAIGEAYAEVRKPKPMVIILQSPLQAMMAIKFMKHFKEISDGGQLGDQLGDQLRGQLRGQLGDQLRGQLWGQLGGQLGDQLGDQLWDQLWGQLGDQGIYDAGYLWGSQDLFWIAWAKFAEHIGVNFTIEQSRRLDIMKRIGFECEWWWPYEGFCFVSERPKYVRFDDGRLHGENGPAVEYDDGYALYAWRGTRIPEEWIKDKSSITPDIALTWENAEQRRAAIEIVGWDNVLKKLKSKTIDKDEDPMIGELIEVKHASLGETAERFLRVKCGTGRWFAIPVPPEMKTALEANAWTYNLKPEQYTVEVRT